MCEQVYATPDIYKIDVPLPDNPLRNLNCYVIKTPQKNLIVDTGFALPECLKALRAGLSELEIDLNNTELFLTHLHSDHIGLASTIMPEKSTIYMGATDYHYYKNISSGRYHDRSGLLTEKDFKVLRKGFLVTDVRGITTVDSEYKIQVGEHQFTCVATPGHTPGHMCLYLEKEKLMFLGDHVLFDITPNISYWRGIDDSLQDYLNSLKKIRSYQIRTPLAAHRCNDFDIYRRIDEIIEHHNQRLQEIMDIVKEHEGLNAQEIAARMTWEIQGAKWENYPLMQRWFAIGEVIAHLDHLCTKKLLVKHIQKGQERFFR